MEAVVEVPLESCFEGEGETLVFLTLEGFSVESFGLFGEDVDLGVAIAVSSLVGVLADLREEGVAGSCLDLCFPLFSRVDLLRFGV